MQAEELPTEIKTKKQDMALSYAKGIANGSIGNEYVYCLQEDKFYKYENGVWRHVFDLEFLADASKAIPEISRYQLFKRKQILDNYKLIKYKTLKDFNWCNMLNLKNGMINPYDGSPMEHDKIYYSTIMLNYEYDESAKCELWLKTLMEIFEEDKKKIELLQEFFGYCLVPDVEQKKAMLLLGESDTGKSTILFTLRELIGQKNCSSVPLKYLSHPQYTPMMINKLVNIDADVDRNAANYEAEFKIITSGEPISCNQKFVETFDFIPKCKVVLAANIFPKITDHSSAFYKRLILLPCDRIFDEKEKNRNLVAQLREELPGILNWAMAGLRRLKERGRFEHHDFMKNAVQELEDDNNPINTFFDEHIEVVLGAEIEKGILYELFKQWAEKTKTYQLSKNRFGMALYRKYHKHTLKNSSNPETFKRVWKNLQYVQLKHDKIKQEDKGWQ